MRVQTLGRDQRGHRAGANIGEQCAHALDIGTRLGRPQLTRGEGLRAQTFPGVACGDPGPSTRLRLADAKVGKLGFTRGRTARPRVLCTGDEVLLAALLPLATLLHPAQYLARPDFGSTRLRLAYAKVGKRGRYRGRRLRLRYIL